MSWWSIAFAVVFLKIVVKGPSCTTGYYKDPENTAQLFDSEGWMRTGDIGIWTEVSSCFVSLMRLSHFCWKPGFVYAMLPRLSQNKNLIWYRSGSSYLIVIYRCYLVDSHRGSSHKNNIILLSNRTCSKKLLVSRIQVDFEVFLRIDDAVAAASNT